MNEDKLYAFIMRGELTKSALEKTGTVSKYSMSEVLAHEYIDSLSLDLLDEELVNSARAMATVYTAIAAFENSVRRFVVKILIETKGENWGYHIPLLGRSNYKTNFQRVEYSMYMSSRIADVRM